MQEAQAEDSKLKAHAYLKPSVLRDSWRDVLRSVQQETRSVIVVPRVAPSQAYTSGALDQVQNAEQDSGASKVSVATSDIAAQHGILHTGDVCCPPPPAPTPLTWNRTPRFFRRTTGPLIVLAGQCL